jgi:hypothetical protein
MKRFLAWSLALLVPIVTAQRAPSDAMTAGHEALDRGEYLHAVSIYKAAALKSDGTIADESLFQSWEQSLPMVEGELPVGGLRPRSAGASSLDHKALAQLLRTMPSPRSWPAPEEPALSS